MLILFSLPHECEEVLSKLVLPAIINRIAMARNGLKSISALLSFVFLFFVKSAGFFIFSPSTTTLCLSVVEVLVATDFFTGAYTSVDVVELLVVVVPCFFGLVEAASSLARSEVVVLYPLPLCCDFSCSVVDVVVGKLLGGFLYPASVEIVVWLTVVAVPITVTPVVSVAANAVTVQATISATAKCNDIKSLFNIDLVSARDNEISKLL